MQGSDGAGARVLVVEDEFVIARNLVKMLQSLGHHPVGPAGSVTKGLKILECENPPDAAILDEHLGGELVTPIAERLSAQSVPFVIVSGHLRSLSPNALLASARRLEKPITRGCLAEALTPLLQQPPFGGNGKA